MVSKNIKTIKCSEGHWEFFDSDGVLVSRHITAGHMAQQYCDLFNELMRLRDTLEEIAKTVTERRDNAADPNATCPYADTDAEAFCYFRGQREALTGINVKAYDAIRGMCDD